MASPLETDLGSFRSLYAAAVFSAEAALDLLLKSIFGKAKAPAKKEAAPNRKVLREFSELTGRS